MLDLYKNIRELRKGLRMSQEDLASRTGYSDRSSIAKIEKGEVDLPQSKIPLFASALGVSPSELMGNTGISSHNDRSDSMIEVETSNNKYYFDDDTAQMAQTLFEDKDMRILFDAARDSRPEDLQMVADMLKRLKDTNPEG